MLGHLLQIPVGAVNALLLLQSHTLESVRAGCIPTGLRFCGRLSRLAVSLNPADPTQQNRLRDELQRKELEALTFIE